MDPQNQIHLSAAIYEQFAQNVSETAALDLLRAKFSLKSVNLSEIEQWYKKFRNEDGIVSRQFIGINDFDKVHIEGIDEFRTSCIMTSFAVEGCFMITKNFQHAHLINICHSQLRQLEYDFSSFFPTDSKQNPKKDPNWIYNVSQIFLVNLQSVLLCYYECQEHQIVQHLSFGEIDWQNSKIVVHSPIQLPHNQVMMQIVGQTQESNLTDGVLVYCVLEDYQHGSLQTLTLDQNKQLHTKTVLGMPNRIMICGLIDGHVYGFKMNEQSNLDYEKLLVISISMRQMFELKTTNGDLLGKRPIHHYRASSVLVDKTLFTIWPSQDHSKSCLLSLNLETYKWTNTGVEFESSGYSLHTDAERSLILTKPQIVSQKSIRLFYRFSVKPDLLQNLVWLAIKRRSDYDPSFYSHIISQLPKNSKFKCPFPSSS